MRYCSSSSSAPFQVIRPCVAWPVPPTPGWKFSTRSVDSASVWAPGFGPAVIPCLALTVALHSRLSNKTSRLHRYDLGRAVGWSACSPRSGGGPTECAPGSPCGRGSLRLREGVGFLSWFVVSLFLFLSRSGGGNAKLHNKKYHL